MSVLVLNTTTITTNTMEPPQPLNLTSTSSSSAKPSFEIGLVSHLLVQIIFYILYSVIFLLGLFGNILVCYIVYSNKAMQTVTNLFITNLALADILLCVLCVPFTPLYTFLGQWVFGSLTCHLVSYAQATSVYISTLTLTAIAVDRFFVILHPLRQRMKLFTCLSILCGIWAFSMLITLPYGVYMQETRLDHPERVLCEENWPYDHVGIAFGSFTLIMQFLVPFCVIRHCYARISRRLNERAKAKPGTKSARREEADKEKKRRTNRMLIAMVAIFGVCWLPLNLINVVDDFYVFEGEPYFHLLFFLAHSLAMSSTCYNPFLYAWLNENFRKEFKVILPCILRSATNRYCNGDEQTLDTLLHSTVYTSPAKQLEPREPIAEPIPPQTQEYNNSSGIIQENDMIHDELIQVTFFMIYTTIFILGIFGNVLVCYVVFRNRAMQTVTNLFITNLALSDILLCVFAVPFTPLYTFLGEWVFGRVICHLLSYAQGASVYISTLTLMSIAIDRFFVIIYPFHPRMKLSTCIMIILVIWLFSMLVTLPYGIYMKHITSNEGKHYCDEYWPSEKWRRIFGGLTTCMQFVLPFFIIKFCYICVSIKLNDRARSKPGSKNSRKEEADRERKRRTNRMLIAMVAIFLVSWLPLNLFNIINDFYHQISNWEYYFVSFFCVHAIAMSSTCYNPFLYAWLNENFRKEFKQVLPCFDTASGRVQAGGRLGNWRSERTCNGNNETQQESLLQSGVHRAASVRKSTPPPLKADSVEVENIMVPSGNNLGAVYDSAAETVRLKLITEEEPPPYEASMKTPE